MGRDAPEGAYLGVPWEIPGTLLTFLEGTFSKTIIAVVPELFLKLWSSK